MKKRRQKVRIKSVSSVLLSILLVTSLTASLSIAILTTTSPPVSAQGNLVIENCVPDLGQHSRNWCWVASAANSMYWLSQHGYLQLIDNLADPTTNDNEYIKTMISVNNPLFPGDKIYDLLQEIAKICLYPGVPGITIDNTWDKGIFNNQYFFGLQNFINQQVAALTVHEIVDNNSLASIPDNNDNIVIYGLPTLDNYKNNILENRAVLLWLASNGRNENTQDYPYRYEDTDHVVTGVGFNTDNTFITVSDPWTTGSPDHGNDLFHAPENHPYDNLVVLNSAPLIVRYPVGPTGVPVAVIGLIYITPTTPAAPVDNYKRDNMPDLGQHCDNWCWTAAAANVFKWYYHNGYTELMDNLENNVPDDNNYLNLLPAGPGDKFGDNLPDLLNEIAKDCLYPNVAEENENTIPFVGPNGTWCHPIDDNKYFLGLQKFIREQGVPLKVSEIIDNDHFVGLPENIPPENDNVVVYAKPTFDNYKNGLKLGNVLLQLPFRNSDYEPPYATEALDHIVTGVSYYDGVGAGNQWILVSDPWTLPPPNNTMGPDHNIDESRYTYENLTVLSANPLTVMYMGNALQVVKLIFISPVAVTENFTLHLVAGWNLVGFPLENESTTPTNLFGSNLKTMKYWTAPSGPYKDAPFGSAVQDNLGYWVQLKANQDVILSGMYPTSRTLYLVAGWNLVHFPLTSASTTPTNLFGSNLKTMKYWTAPSGPYKDAPFGSAVVPGVGYWVQLKANQSVTIPL
jgi:hypothetical protein